MMYRLESLYLALQHIKVEFTPLLLGERSLVNYLDRTDDIRSQVLSNFHLAELSIAYTLTDFIVMSDVIIFEKLDSHRARMIHQPSNLLLSLIFIQSIKFERAVFRANLRQLLYESKLVDILI